MIKFNQIWLLSPNTCYQIPPPYLLIGFSRMGRDYISALWPNDAVYCKTLTATRCWCPYNLNASFLLSEIRGEKFGIPKDSRLTFHPQHEIPQMRKWFNSCKTPSDEKLKFFAAELNKGHVRQERPNVTVAKLKIWWKNERQREKRIQQQTHSENEARGGKCDEDESQPSTSSDEIPSTSKSYVELTNVSSDLLSSELLCKNSFSSDGSNTGDLFNDTDFHWTKH